MKVCGVAVDIADILDTVVHGDALSVLRQLPSNSLDAVVTDPPAGIGFMQSATRQWDSDKGGRDQWIAWLSEIMREAYRCLKPGAHALIWSLPRTSHWTATALENAGFEIRDNLYHVYAADAEIQGFLASLTEEQQQAFWKILEGQGEQSFLLHCFGSGFPKSLDVGKAIDKLKGAEREVVGERVYADGHKQHSNAARFNGTDYAGGNVYHEPAMRIDTAPATPEAQQHNGKGTALKPSVETWWLCRKPLSEKSVAENVLKWNTGAINIDKTRVNIAENEDLSRKPTPAKGWKNTSELNGSMNDNWKQGRWPSHLLLSHSLFCQRIGTTKVKANNAFEGYTGENTVNAYEWQGKRSQAHHKDANGLEEVEVWQCVPGCPVLEMDRQSGIRKSGYRINPSTNKTTWFGATDGSHIEGERGYKDEGSASRYFQQLPAEAPASVVVGNGSGNAPFFYAAKASSRERSKGLEKLPYAPSGAYGNFKGDGRGRQTEHTPAKNNHPTVKSLSLCRHLLRTIVPENGTVLDCFAGSGSTLVAAIQENLHFIGIEQLDTEQEPYCTIARSRIADALQKRAEALQETPEGALRNTNQ